MRVPSRLLAAFIAVVLTAAIPSAVAVQANLGRSPVTVTTIPGPVDWSGLSTGIGAQARWYEHAVNESAFYSEISRRIEAARAKPRTVRRSPSVRSAVDCIAGTENNGDYGRSSNPNHFGRYQYDPPTWAANGGNPDTWGSASPEEQDRVFANTLARYGTGPWHGDGCA